jgi:DNA-binding MarR family transcriptional regulator
MAKTHPTHPERHIGYWLRFVAAHAVHALGVDLGAHEVTAAEWPVLRDLFDREEQASTQGELAKRLGLSRGAISKLVARLVAKGLIEIYEDETDGRSQVVVLSPNGHDLVPDLAATADRSEARFFGHLKPADRARLLEILREIAERRGLKEPSAE